MASSPGASSGTAVLFVGTVVQPVVTEDGHRTVVVHERAAVGVDAAGWITRFDAHISREDEEEAAVASSSSSSSSGDGSWMVRRLGPTQFLMPGLIDAHIHAPQFAYTGTATDVQLMQWLERYTFPSESRLKDDLALARQVYVRMLECVVAHGTTTALYFATKDLAPTKLFAQLAAAKGQRAYIGKVSMDRHAPDHYVETTEQALRDAEAFIRWTREELRCPLVHPVVTPRFLPTCTEGLLRGLGELVRRYPGVHVQSHISESADQVEFGVALSHCHEDTHRDAEVFDRCGLLTPRTVLAHGVHLRTSELALFRERGAAIAHCPLSNFFFAHGVLPARKAMDMGVKVGLGTDVAGGYSPSMLSAVRHAVIAARVLEEGTQNYRHNHHLDGTAPGPGGCDGGGGEKGQQQQQQQRASAGARIDWKEALWMATAGAGRALGIEGEVGSFGVGMAFDALVVDVGSSGVLGAVVCMEGRDEREDLVQKFINNGDDRHILEVFVQGQEIKQGRRLREAE